MTSQDDHVVGHQQSGPASGTELHNFGWAALLIPLKTQVSVRPNDEWRPGPWPVTDGRQAVSVPDRLRRYHVQGPIEHLTSPEQRCWRVVDKSGQGVRYPTAELLSVSVSGVKRAYLILHVDLVAGPRGGRESTFATLSKLTRLQSADHRKTIAALVSTNLQIDDRFMRATTLVGLPEAAGLEGRPPRVQDPDLRRAWLVACTDLPRPNESSYEADEREIFSVVPGVQGAVAAAGVAVYSARGQHLRERTFRAHYVDALLLAVVQRDVLLELGSRLAGDHRVAPRRAVLQAFDEFRSTWWKPVAVDHPVSRVIGDRWRGCVGVDKLMDQLIGEVADLHAERRTRRAEMTALVSIVVAVVAAVAAAMDVVLT